MLELSMGSQGDYTEEIANGPENRSQEMRSRNQSNWKRKEKPPLI